MLEKIAAFKALVESQNPTAPIRKAITDSEAVELIAELEADGLVDHLPHSAKAIAAAAAMTEVLAKEVPTELDALQAWAEAKGAASKALWDALQGSVVDGVEIIRKRPL